MAVQSTIRQYLRWATIALTAAPVVVTVSPAAAFTPQTPAGRGASSAVVVPGAPGGRGASPAVVVSGSLGGWGASPALVVSGVLGGRGASPAVVVSETLGGRDAAGGDLVALGAVGSSAAARIAGSTAVGAVARTGVPALSGAPALPGAVATVNQPLIVGGPGVLLTFPGQGAAGFSAVAGQRLSLLAQRKTLTATDNTDVVIRRNGTMIAEGTLITTWSDVSVDFTAPSAGAYTVEVKPRTTDRGTLLLSLAGSTSGTLTIGGPPQKVTIAKPGERAFLTFPATAGRFTLVARRMTLPKDEYTHLDIHDPSGGTATAGAVGYNSDYRTLDFDVTTVGRHTVEVNPDTSGTGTLMLQLVGTVAATLTPGRPARINFAKAGERAYVTFRAAEAEQFRLTARRGTLTATAETNLRIRTPAGLDVVDGTLTTKVSTVTLGFSSSAGTYTIDINPEGLDTGTLTLDLQKLP